MQLWTQTVGTGSLFTESFPVQNKPCLPIWITQHSLHNFHFYHQPWHWIWELFWARTPLITLPNSHSRVAGGNDSTQAVAPQDIDLGDIGRGGNKTFQQFPLETGHEEKTDVMRKQAGKPRGHRQEGTQKSLFIPESFPDLHCSQCLYCQGLATSSLVMCKGLEKIGVGNTGKTQKKPAQKQPNTTKRHTHTLKSPPNYALD